MQRELRFEILGLEFPINVTDATEPRIQQAVALLQERLAHYQGRFSVSDKLYLALMVAIDLAGKLADKDAELHEYDTGIADRLAQLTATLDNALVEEALS